MTKKVKVKNAMLKKVLAENKKLKQEQDAKKEAQRLDQWAVKGNKKVTTLISK